MSIPEYSEENVLRLIDKLVYLHRNKELDYNKFVPEAYVAHKLATPFAQGGFSKWLHHENAATQRRWTWLKRDEYVAIISYLFERKPWIVSYFPIFISNNQLLKNPFVQSLSSFVHSNNPITTEFVSSRVCGIYQIFRPSMEVQESTLLGRMDISAARELGTFTVTEQFKAENVGHWRLSGHLLARSERFFSIISTSDTNNVPEIKYITHIPQYNVHNDPLGFKEVTVMRGFVSDVHGAHRFYKAQLYIIRVQDVRDIIIDVVHNKVIERKYNKIYNFFLKWYDNAFNHFLIYND